MSKRALYWVKAAIEPRVGQEVVYTKIEGNKHTEYKGVLKKLYSSGAIIELNQDHHKIKMYYFSYVKLMQEEGVLHSWDPEADKRKGLIFSLENEVGEHISFGGWAGLPFWKNRTYRQNLLL